MNIIWTRFRQGIRALTAWGRPVDLALAASVLTPAQMALFRRLRRGEQIHALHVLRAVRAAGETDPDLAVAALLHDVGKTVATFWFHERVAVVLVRKFLPALYYRLAKDSPADCSRPPRGVSRAFAISLHHAVWSAELLAGAGGSDRAVELCRRHDEYLTAPPRGETERLLLVLQSADNAN